MPSFVWDYFVKVNSIKARCVVGDCNREIMYHKGTGGLIGHLRCLHNVVSDQDKSSNSSAVDTRTEDRKKKKSMLENYQKASERLHTAGKDNKTSKQLNVRKPNCYICNSSLGSVRYELITLTGYSETPVYEILEFFTDTKLTPKERIVSAVCTQCFVSLNKFDDLQQQSQEIQKRLTGLFHEKSRTETVFVKEEPDFDCGEAYQPFSKDELGIHKNDFHGEIYSFKSDVAMQSNKFSSNSSSSDDTEYFDGFKEKRLFDCKSCGITFTNKEELDKHEESHRNLETYFGCDLCAKSYRLKSSLELHLALDHGPPNGPFDCPICFKTYLNPNSLRCHYKFHKAEKNFLCVKCGAVFSHKQSFTVHMLMHEDVRPFPCEIPGCPKRFRNAAKLRIHLRVHTGEKNFECSFCPGKRYREKRGLDWHVKHHHKDQIELPVKCKICGMKIPSSSKLQLHLERIHQESASNYPRDLKNN